jgi:tetratricopeptide (TPR) repeat protein
MFLLICTITTNIASAATVHLEMTDKNNAPLTSGSGFFVSDTLIVTNADAIKDAVTGTAQVVGKDKKHAIEGVAAVDPKNEIVLLRVLPSGAAPLPLGDSDTIKIGDTVVPSNALAALVKRTEQSEQEHDPIGNIHVEYFFMLGIAHTKSGNPQKAVPYYTVVTTIKPDYAIAYYHRGNAKRELSEAYFNRGNTKQNLGKYKAAILDYDAAVKIKPDYYEAYIKRGDAKFARRRYKDAIADFDAAIRIKPNHAVGHHNRGHAKYLLRQYEMAISDYDIAIGINPHYVNAYYNRGRAKYALGQYTDALADFDVLLNRYDRGDHLDYYFRGRARNELGQYADAIADLDISIKINSKYPYAYHVRGKAKAALGQYKAAIADYDKAVQENNAYPDFYYSRGDAKAKLGDNDGALSDYAIGAYHRGVRHRNAGRILEAKQDFEIVLKLVEQLGDKQLKINAERELKNLQTKSE